MKKLVFTFVFLLALCTILFPQQIILAVSDFEVESNNPDHEFIGKGISRLVAGGLRKSKDIKIIEREKLKQILEEQKLSLSGLMDDTNQIQLGMLISAEYMIFGEIINMGSNLLISLRIVNLTTGEVEWQEEITEKLETYDYIGAYFTKNILTHFGIEIEDNIVTKIENKEEKNVEAIVLLSEGIDAFDKDDVESAKTKLKAAKNADPLSEASEIASYYLSLLSINTSKFRVLTQAYYSYQNPAFLGILRTDRIHLSFSSPADIFGSDGFTVPNIDNRYLREEARNLSVGYYFPIGRDLGLGLEAFYFQINAEADDVPDMWGDSDSAAAGRIGFGGIFNIGYKIVDNISLGLGSTLYLQLPLDWRINPDEVTSLAFNINAGFLYRNNDETFIYDLRYGYSSGTIDIVDIDTVTIDKIISAPIFLENTFTFALKNKNLFIVLKQLNDIGIDRAYYFGRILPAVELYFHNWLSFRSGVEGSLVKLNDTINFGYAIMNGMTYKVIDTGFDMDINLSYRIRPSTIIDNVMYPEFLLSLSLSWNDVYLSR